MNPIDRRSFLKACAAVTVLAGEGFVPRLTSSANAQTATDPVIPTPLIRTVPDSGGFITEATLELAKDPKWGKVINSLRHGGVGYVWSGNDPQKTVEVKGTFISVEIQGDTMIAETCRHETRLGETPLDKLGIAFSFSAPGSQERVWAWIKDVDPDSSRDIAVLQADLSRLPKNVREGLKPLTFGDDNLKLNETYLAAGFPAGAGGKAFHARLVKYRGYMDGDDKNPASMCLELFQGSAEYGESGAVCVDINGKAKGMQIMGGPSSSLFLPAGDAQDALRQYALKRHMPPFVEDTSPDAVSARREACWARRGVAVQNTGL